MVSISGKSRQKGQGVIEYAGALVIATVLVSMAMFIVPDEMAALLSNIMTTAGDFFMTAMDENMG
jgi:hypothetical protein